MAGKRKTAREQSAMITYCGMAAGLSVAIMLLGGVFPIATYAVPMLCGTLLLPVLLEFGKGAAWGTFFSVAALALLLGFDKEAAFFYLFIGYYPIVKWSMDRLKPKAWQIAAKLLLFTGSMTLMYGLLYLLFPMEEMIEEFREMGTVMFIVFVILYVFCMMLYDWVLVRLVFVYANRIRPKLKFLKRL